MSKLSSLLNTYKSMVASKESDRIESNLVNSGQANFLASSRGHEGSALLNIFLNENDWLCCHYRDKALMLARGITNEQFFYSALCKKESHSAGRQMVSHMSDRSLNITSIVGPVGNNALQAAGIAKSIKNNENNPIVVCSTGDGTTQQGEYLEAIAESKRNGLPILFFIHNNELAISTKTVGQTFFSLPANHNSNSFYDIPITRVNGKDPFQSYNEIETVVERIRTNRSPEILILNVDRLSDHSNADNQLLYRTQQEINDSLKNHDPIENSKKFLLNQGVTESQLLEVEEDVAVMMTNALSTAEKGTAPEVEFGAKRSLDSKLLNAGEYTGDTSSQNRVSMLEAIRETLRSQLGINEDLYLLGEDIEDGKGDVFGITKGLSTRFPTRVNNSALSESTILGMSIGMALTGKQTVAFIQFADFLPLAYNQIMTELSTMYWRTNGSWECPVIILAACGGYRPGLGPFHSQTNEATYAHIPGLDVYMPSTAGDAAGLLNAAILSKRPSLFLYPKKLLNSTGVNETTSLDIDKHLVPIGKAKIVRGGNDITLVGWGNTVSICEEVAETLESIHIYAEVIDLRTINPYDIETISASAQKTEKLIVIHEDNKTCGLGGDIIASVVERSSKHIQTRRITRPDTLTPCNFANQLEVLPSYEKMLEVACELLNIDLKWQEDKINDTGLFDMKVIGPSPSDESVIIIDLKVAVDDIVEAGDVLAEIEATKSTGEIISPVKGKIKSIFVKNDESIFVGENLLQIEEINDGKASSQNLNSIQSNKIAKLTLKSNQNKVTATVSSNHKVGVCIPEFKTGSRKVMNSELLVNFPDRTDSDIVSLTGIKSRFWLEKDETLVSIATKASINTLQKNNLKLQDIDYIICATCSPDEYISPSMASNVLFELYKKYGEHHILAVDINAACSGYLYALSQANDYLKDKPNKRVLVLTAEAMSKKTNPKDFNTAFIFADAASATIVVGSEYLSEAKAKIKNISLSSIACDPITLNIPIDHSVVLQGKYVFTNAVKYMSKSLYQSCALASLKLQDLSVVIPHQANQRITSAVERRLKLSKNTLYSNIEAYGNTSSSTIPIAMNECINEYSRGNNIALCAFGSGFTYGSILLEII
jgi:2-oxoisovalerate dehydrogenase E1 component